MSAKKALLHPYFDDLDKSTLPAADIGSFWTPIIKYHFNYNNLSAFTVMSVYCV